MPQIPVVDDPETEEPATLARGSAESLGLARTELRPARVKRFDDVSEHAPAPLSLAAPAQLQGTGFDQRYEARSVLGEGGMGEVRLTRDRLIGRDVALKVMRPGVAVHQDLRERFVREARVQGQLEHPAIVPVYDLGVDPDGNVFFTMKRVRGKTLDAVIDALASGDPEAARRYSRRKLLTAFSSVCLAVDFAHAHGVLHRDLKPGNIILGDFGEVYVLDWGLAKLAGSAEDVGITPIELAADGAAPTLVGALVGTPGYMAPEQARGDVERVDVFADVYALGAILFEILALEPLHPLASTEAAIVSTLRGVDARPSARTLGEYPPELEAICVRATASDPLARFGGARELSNAIERFLDGDRNLALRRDLAASHVAAAQAALAAGARTDALREVGSALALDPRNAEALGTMARLLSEVPAEVPREAQAELDAAAGSARRQAARSGAMRFVFWNAFVPVATWMGLRDLGASAAVIATAVTCGAFALWLARRRRVELRHGLVLLGLSSLVIAMMSAVFGPFILVPGQAATNTMFFAMSADKRQRRVVILAGVLAVLAPFALEALGILPRSTLFTGGQIHVLPRATELPELQTTVFLLLTSAAMVVIPALMIGRMRDALAAAEQRLVLQAWNLRQIVPHEARGTLGEPLSLRRVNAAPVRASKSA